MELGLPSLLRRKSESRASEAVKKTTGEKPTSTKQIFKLPPDFKLRIALTRAKGEDYEGKELDSYTPDGFARLTSSPS
jgi:hypothetical protein